jgi:hypothetical protein
MKDNSNTETILYPLPQKGDKQTMLQIKIECIELDLPRNDWHYNQLEHNEKTATWWFTADEARNVVTRTADGMTMLKCFSFSLHADGTDWRFSEVRHTFTELLADPVQLLLHGESYEDDPQLSAIVEDWFSLVNGIKREINTDTEIVKALSTSLLRSEHSN